MAAQAAEAVKSKDDKVDKAPKGKASITSTKITVDVYKIITENNLSLYVAPVIPAATDRPRGIIDDLIAYIAEKQHGAKYVEDVQPSAIPTCTPV